MTDAEEHYHFDIDLVHLTSDQLVYLAALPLPVIGDRLQISALIFRPRVSSPGRCECHLLMDGQVVGQNICNPIQLRTPVDN